MIPVTTYRYLATEVVKSSLATLLVLLIILMSNTLSGVLEYISLGKWPEQALIPLLLKQAIATTTLLIPFCFFLGVIFSFGRLYEAYEMPVLNACGLGYRQMLIPIFVVILPFFIIDTYLSLSLSASGHRYAQEIVHDFKQQDEFQQIEAGRFNVLDEDHQVFYMESMSDDRSQLYNVIFSQFEDDQQSITIADKGIQTVDKETNDAFLELSPGVRYEGFPGDADFKVIEFETQGVLIDIQQQSQWQTTKLRELPFKQLFGSENKKEQIELQWRMATPMVLLVLGFVAVPLSYVAPRKGRYGKLAVAILVYILYSNALGSMLVWVENDVIAVEYGFWLVHFVFLLFGFGLIAKRNRLFSRIAWVK